jgi:hypothetical protein
VVFKAMTLCGFVDGYLHTLKKDTGGSSARLITMKLHSVIIQKNHSSFLSLSETSDLY